MKNIQLLNNLGQIHLKLKRKELKLVTMHKVCIQIYFFQKKTIYSLPFFRMQFLYSGVPTS
jgi:hypothetical protein